MIDVSEAAKAKSNQLNAVDIQGVEPVITISSVKVTNESGKKTVWVSYHGDNNRPWRVSTGMVRGLIAGWGADGEKWIGKKVKIFCNPEVTFGSDKVGGIQIRGMSDIPSEGITFLLSLNRRQRVPFTIECISNDRPTFPQDRFDKSFSKMVDAMQNGDSIEKIVAQCQKVGDLTKEQLEKLQEFAPLHVEDGE